jgi:hypothetical protein
MTYRRRRDLSIVQLVLNVDRYDNSFPTQTISKKSGKIHTWTKGS